MLINKQRKKRANELKDDNYEYVPESSNSSTDYNNYNLVN